jgi:hypothetical protein
MIAIEYPRKAIAKMFDAATVGKPKDVDSYGYLANEAAAIVFRTFQTLRAGSTEVV